MENEKLFNAIVKVAAEEAWQEEMDSMPSLEELNEMYPPSEALNKRVYGEINKAARRGKIKKAIRTTSKLVAGFCVFIVLAGGLLLSVEASRTFILSRIINMGDDYVQINFRLGYAADLKVGELVINYIPDDFVFYTQGELAEGYYYYMFKSDTRRGIMIGHLIVSDCSSSVSMYTPMPEYSEFTIISLNGQIAYLFISPTHNTISWSYGRHFISVAAWLDADELIKIAEGITIK
ncbi:MAG: DUF4367 domain-containing protein [Defluviitaleaceae bacterium]|nr:DUF4367 domain-containing protein [Defluviitaleaceae bacterium]MCL2262923.1 DUF4367 domain-containing protein [Defluviitaleaceae bacterium]